MVPLCSHIHSLIHTAGLREKLWANKQLIQNIFKYCSHQQWCAVWMTFYHYFIGVSYVCTLITICRHYPFVLLMYICIENAFEVEFEGRWNIIELIYRMEWSARSFPCAFCFSFGNAPQPQRCEGRTDGRTIGSNDKPYHTVPQTRSMTLFNTRPRTSILSMSIHRTIFRNF